MSLSQDEILLNIPVSEMKTGTPAWPRFLCSNALTTICLDGSTIIRQYHIQMSVNILFHTSWVISSLLQTTFDTSHTSSCFPNHAGPFHYLLDKRYLGEHLLDGRSTVLFLLVMCFHAFTSTNFLILKLYLLQKHTNFHFIQANIIL